MKLQGAQIAATQVGEFIKLVLAFYLYQSLRM